jgi:Ca2+-binding RTX toxin-like protein
LGNDTVLGGTGNDTIGGMAGSDFVLAGDGDDFIAWNDPTGDLVFGNRGNDTIIGGDVAADTIFGGSGDDIIRAFATNASASTASDIIIGGDGRDVIQGSDAVDTIDGGAGDDFLTGNRGADAFVYLAVEGNLGNDIITDFETNGDVVQLVGFGAGFDPLASLTDGDLGAVLDLGNDSSIVFLGRRAVEFNEGSFLLV